MDPSDLSQVQVRQSRAAGLLLDDSSRSSMGSGAGSGPTNNSSSSSSSDSRCAAGRSDEDDDEEQLERGTGNSADRALDPARDEVLQQARPVVARSSLQQQQQPQQEVQKPDYEEVKQVELFGVRIVALTINGRERLCLAQISNTLLKEFSYNEIHNRRVALGITCVQCTPIQLEMLRRAGAMPSSSRRCGMITVREAERLCRSFLVEEQPPELPENFYFTVAHRVNYGCKGRFIPARYISSRAKCIECFFCGEFYSPNKFIFHSHRQPHATDCNPPDSPNINSWRKHIDLDWSQEHSQEIKYAWEDVKSLFNGGTRRRAPHSAPTTLPAANGKQAIGSRSGRRDQPVQLDSTEEQLIDVECDDVLPANKHEPVSPAEFKPDFGPKRIVATSVVAKSWPNPPSNRLCQTTRQSAGSLMLGPQQGVKSASFTPAKRAPQPLAGGSQPSAKRFATSFGCYPPAPARQEPDKTVSNERAPMSLHSAAQGGALAGARPFALNGTAESQFADFLGAAPRHRLAQMNQNQNQNGAPNSGNKSTIDPSLIYPNSSFLYNQLYSQLMQPQQQQQQQPQQQQQLSSAMDTQLALRHHIWSNLLANLQCNAANQTYSLQHTGCSVALGELTSDVSPASLSHLISAQLHQQQQQQQAKLQPAQSQTSLGRAGPFALQKFSAGETGDI